MFRIKSYRPLTLKDIQDYSKPLIKLNLNEFETEEDLYDCDFVFVEMTLNNVDYVMVHGFPGDTAGVIFNDHVNYLIGALENPREPPNPASQWYNQITNNGRNYAEDFWYAAPDPMMILSFKFCRPI